MKRILSFLLIGLLTITAPVNSWSAESNQDRFLQYYLLIQEGDRLIEEEQFATARLRFQEALQGLQTIDKNWEPAIINFRMRDCREKIAELEGREDKSSVDSSTGAPAVETMPRPDQELSQAADSDIETLKLRIQALEQDLKITKSELTEARGTIATLREKLTFAQEELVAAKGGGTDQQVAELLEENNNLKDQLAQAEEQIKNISGEDAEASVALMKAQLKKVQDQLELQYKANEAFEDTTSTLKQQLAAARSALDVAQSNTSQAVNPDAFARENDVLRNIIERQLKEQARRDAARKLAQAELESLQVESQALQEQIDILASPLIELSNNELAMLRNPSPEVQPPGADLVAQLPDESTPIAVGQPVEAAIVYDETADSATQAEPALTEAVAAVDEAIDKAEAVAMTATTDPITTPGDGTAASEPVDGLPNIADDLAAMTDPPATETTPSDKSVPETVADTTTRVVDAVAPADAVVDTPEETTIVAVDGPAETPSQARDYSSTPIVPDDLKEEARKASELFSSGRHDEAADIYQQMIDQYPESLYAWSNLGVVRFEQQDLNEAETALERAVKLSPSDGFSYSILGIVYYQRGNYDDAVEALTRAKTLDPNDARTRNYLGIACSQKGWQEAAEQELRKAVELDPGFADAHFNLAVIYATQKPPSKGLANKHYETAKRLGIPGNPQLDLLLK